MLCARTVESVCGGASPRRRRRTCLALAPKTDVFERGLEFVRRGMREGGQIVLEIWLATNPPKLIVDRTANKRHALHMMESTLNEMLNGECSQKL